MMRLLKIVVIAVAGMICVITSPVRAALIAHYSFDNATIFGSTLQNIANPGNSDGTIFASGGAVTTGVAGISGEAFQFNTVGSVSLGTGVVKSQLEGTQTWSISAWVNMSSVTPGHILYRREVGGTTDAEGGLRVEAGNLPQAFVQDGSSSSTFLNSPVSIDVGEWAHVAGIREGFPGNDWRLYLDGVEFSGPGTSLSLESTAGVPEIGIDLDGLIDEVRVYDHALTQGEVLTLFAEGQQAQVSAPGTFLIFGLGLAGLGLARRRKVLV